MFSISAFKEWAAPCFHYRPRAAWPVMGVVLLLTGGLLLASMKDYQRRDALQRQHQHLLETVAKRDEIVRGLSARMKKHQPDARAAMQVVAMLNPLAKLLLPDVAIMNVSVEPEKKVVRLQVKAISLEALLDFSTRLEAIPARVELQNHTPSKELSQKWAVNATLIVIYPNNPRL